MLTFASIILTYNNIIIIIFVVEPNPCGIKNGGCSDLCLLNGHGIACACPHLKKLHTDNKTCISKLDSCLLSINEAMDLF